MCEDGVGAVVNWLVGPATEPTPDVRSQALPVLSWMLFKLVNVWVTLAVLWPVRVMVPKISNWANVPVVDPSETTISMSAVAGLPGRLVTTFVNFQVKFVGDPLQPEAGPKLTEAKMGTCTR